MKTPGEIKKALKCHRDGRACHDCPYEQGRTFSVDGVTFGCSQDIVADALAYIEQLESRVKIDLPRGENDEPNAKTPEADKS